MPKKKISKKEDFYFESMPSLKPKKGAKLKNHDPEKFLSGRNKVGTAMPKNK